MSNTLAYRLSLASGTFVSGMRQAQDTVRGLNREAANANSQLGRMGAATSTSSRYLQMAADAALGTTMAFGGVTSAAGLFFSALGASRIVLGAVAEIDSLTRALAGMEGSTEAAAARLEVLRKVAKVPGLGFTEAVQGDIRLRAVGFSAKQSEAFCARLAMPSQASAEERRNSMAPSWALPKWLPKAKS
jgi:hypothetical protein